MKTIIDAHTSSDFNLAELGKFKSLLWNLSIRDVLVRYKQTAVGVLWAVVRPAINIAIFVFFSQYIEGITTVSERFISVSSGIIIWALLSTSVSDISNSLVSNANILTKVYFPKIIIPMSSLLVCLIDFFISFLILVVCKLFVSGSPGIEFFLFPVFVLYGLVLSFGIGLIFATLNVRYRDVKFTLPFLIQIGFYACPVFLSTSFYLSKLPPILQTIFLANPLVTIIDGFRYCFLGHSFNVPLASVLTGIGFTLLLLLFSLNYFKKFEKSFADFI